MREAIASAIALFVFIAITVATITVDGPQPTDTTPTPARDVAIPVAAVSIPDPQPEPIGGPVFIEPDWSVLQDLAAWLDGLAETERAEAERAAAAVVVAPVVSNPAPPAATPSDGVEGWRTEVARWFHPDQVDLFLVIMGCESGGNPSAKNRASSASGLFQMLKPWWRAAGEPGEVWGWDLNGDGVKHSALAEMGHGPDLVWDGNTNIELAYRIATGGSGTPGEWASTSAWNASRHCWG